MGEMKPADKTEQLFRFTPVPRAFLALALPNVLGKLVMLIYNIADTWFVSRTGITELVAGVSLGAPVMLIMVAVGDAFGQGGASVITRLLGKKENDTAKRLSSFCFWGALCAGLILAVVLSLFRTPILYLIGADEDTFYYASQYYRILVLSAPFCAITSVPLNILRTEGLARQSMIGNMTGSIMTLTHDPTQTFGSNMGAAGAAAASSLSYVCSAGYYVWAYGHFSKLLSIRPSLARVSRSEVGSVMAIGIPGCLTNLMQSFGMAMTNRFLLAYGNDKIAAFGISYKISMVTMMILVGFSFGSVSLVGYNYGAGDRDRFRKIVRFLYTFELSVAFIMIVILEILAPVLVRSFLQDESVIAAGTTMLRVTAAGQIFTGFVLATTCVFQAMGQAVGALVLSINRQGILYVILLLLLSGLFGYYGVICAQPVSDFLCTLLGGAVLVHTLRRFYHAAPEKTDRSSAEKEEKP